MIPFRCEFRGVAMAALVLLVAAFGGPTVPARAQNPETVAGGLRMQTNDDGVRVITNEGAVHRARRLTHRRVPVPDPDLEAHIDEAALAHDLDPELIQSVIQTESGYNVRALSRVGAMGLMQLMPATAADLQVEDPYDAEENIHGGTRYLRSLMNRFERLEVALAAYNAGPGTVERYGGIPPYPETRAYVRRVIRLYRGTEPVSLDEIRKPAWSRSANGRPLLTTETPRESP